MDTEAQKRQLQAHSIFNINNLISLSYFIVTNLVLMSLLAIGFQNMGIILIGSMGLAILIFSARGIDKIEWKKLTIYSVAAICFMILVYYGLIERYDEPFYGGDDKLFEEYGRSLYKANIFTFDGVPYIQGMFYAKGYLTIIAWIFRLCESIGGYSTISPRILNIYLWLASVALIYKQIKKRSDTSVVAKKCLPILALYPNALFISSCVYRDTIVTFLMVLSVVTFEEFISAFRVAKVKETYNIVTYVVCFLVGSYLLYKIRPQMMYVMLMICFLYLVWGKFRISFGKKLLLFLIAIVAAYFLFKYSGGLNLLNLIMDGYKDYRIEANEGITKRVFSMSLVPFGLVVRFFYGLICPFPGGMLSLPYFSQPIYSLIFFLIYMMAIMQFYLVPYIVKGMIKLEYRTFRFIVVYCAIIISTFTFRHFIMIYPFAMSAICHEVESIASSKRKKYFFEMTALLAVAVVVYMCMKIL